MKRENVYISGIAGDSAQVAREFGLGLEIAEFCTAWNMDREYDKADRRVTESVTGIGPRVLHGPFSELFPCAVDPKIRAVAMERFSRALELAEHYGAAKLVLHGGFNPYLFYPEWFGAESVRFWREFAAGIPETITVCVENVLEPDPEMLLDVITAVDNPRLRLCLDIGHVNAYCKEPPEYWLEKWKGCLSHFHIHNNDGTRDSHSSLNEGSIPMGDFLRRADALCPDATFTLEVLESRESVEYLLSQGLLQ